VGTKYGQKMWVQNMGTIYGHKRYPVLWN
jgi:hypothetical protein